MLSECLVGNFSARVMEFTKNLACYLFICCIFAWCFTKVWLF